ncbi:hypothetical protein [Streptomyces sp. NBC_00316]|uniref:hypothetical protein n=1 Tax=Streptomyces sp. NBC_00316 TaxID=2975710 RepID=UPI002E2B0C7E|nr:hypothetical protein [Streptomyces sp. NBC_00316]
MGSGSLSGRVGRQHCQPGHDQQKPAALTHQHLVKGRDHAIAAHVDEQIKKVRSAEPAGDGPEEASGT